MIIHLDAPERSDIAFKRFTFPDGQPHIVFDPLVLKQAAGSSAMDPFAETSAMPSSRQSIRFSDA